MVTMMVVSLLNPHDADEMNRAFMLTLSIAARDGSQESVAFMVQQIKGSPIKRLHFQLTCIGVCEQVY